MQHKKPFFSIIIPTYNRGHLIATTITTILNQDFEDFELLVIDDGSTDDTEEVVLKFDDPRIRYSKKENAERGAARNFGTLKAQGNYVNWFDSDDLMHKNHLLEAYSQIENKNYPEVIVLSHNYVFINGDIDKSIIHENDIRKKIHLGNSISCNGIIVRNDIAKENLFSEVRQLSVSEDYELWLRLASNYEFQTSKIVTSSIVLHDERSMFTMNQSEKLINRFELFLKTIDNNNSVKQFLGDNYSYFRMKNYLVLSADLAANKHKSAAVKYLFKGLKNNIFGAFDRLTLAIIKNLIIN